LDYGHRGVNQPCNSPHVETPGGGMMNKTFYLQPIVLLGRAVTYRQTWYGRLKNFPPSGVECLYPDVASGAERTIPARRAFHLHPLALHASLSPSPPVMKHLQQLDRILVGMQILADQPKLHMRYRQNLRHVVPLGP